MPKERSITFFTKGPMPLREEKDLAATLNGKVTFRHHIAGSLEFDKADAYIGYIPEEFKNAGGEIIKDFADKPIPDPVNEAPKPEKPQAQKING